MTNPNPHVVGTSQSRPLQASRRGPPVPPERPVPPLSSLTKTPGSPQLPFIAMELVYMLCATLRRFNGDLANDWEGAAELLLSLSPDAVPQTADDATRQALTRASREGRLGEGIVLGALEDLATVLDLGRSAVLLLFVDGARWIREVQGALGRQTATLSSRLAKVRRKIAFLALEPICACVYRVGTGTELYKLENATAESPHLSSCEQSPPPPNKQGHRQAIRQLLALEKKLTFFVSWANESSDEALQMLAAAGRQAAEEALARKQERPPRPQAPSSLVIEV